MILWVKFSLYRGMASKAFEQAAKPKPGGQRLFPVGAVGAAPSFNKDYCFCPSFG
jgi:hypothetical protein